MAQSQYSKAKNLNEIFLYGWNLFEDLEGTLLPFSGHEYQQKVKNSIKSFEDSTKIVNEIAMFSPNETLDEVPTEDIKYLLLPYFLGKLSTKLNTMDRLTVIELSEIYFSDFLQRCADYELTEAPKYKDNDLVNTKSSAPLNELASLINAAQARNNKISQFKKKKELDEQINLLRKTVLGGSVDDEVKRDFFIKYINRSVIEAREELESLNLEKKMVQIRKTEKSASTTSKSKDVQVLNRQPIKPFVITRDNTQKAVFGMGYPSLPVMSVGEFYNQRVHEGIFPNEEQVRRLNQQQMFARIANPEDKEDEERAADEVLAENDDPEYLQRQRAMDEYKDVVRRGDGNRHNRS